MVVGKFTKKLLEIVQVGRHTGLKQGGGNRTEKKKQGVLTDHKNLALTGCGLKERMRVVLEMENDAREGRDKKDLQKRFQSQR